jgi:hypothetical protein
MYLLGVDGGGTKIEFLITDLEKKEIVHFEYEQNCNLKYTNSSHIIEILKQGFAQISKTIKIDQIVFAYLGIAECGRDSIVNGREEIIVFLKKHLPKFELADDQYSVFRAKSPTKNGVLANAGTGSNINHFYNETEENYKSVGISGRDLGKAILAEIKFGGILKGSEIYLCVENFLDQNPIDFYDNLKSLDMINNSYIPKIPRILVFQTLTNTKLLNEMKRFEIMVASRWSQKLAVYCNINFGYSFEDEFDLVLSGSLWRWENMRYIMTEDLKKTFPNVNLIHDTSKTPVLGSIKIASERYFDIS